jgi:hypothetical protein
MASANLGQLVDHVMDTQERTKMSLIKIRLLPLLKGGAAKALCPTA